jgi:hypothetical protein
MVSQNGEAGRGRHLAPAPEDVSADTPDYSPALSTKQENRPNERSELIRSFSCPHSFFPRNDDDLWVPVGVAANRILERLAHILIDGAGLPLKRDEGRP